MWLDTVQEVPYRFGMLGSLFGFGGAGIEPTGIYGKIVFDSASSTGKRQEKVQAAIHSLDQ